MAQPSEVKVKKTKKVKDALTTEDLQSLVKEKKKKKEKVAPTPEPAPLLLAEVVPETPPPLEITAYAMSDEATVEQILQENGLNAAVVVPDIPLELPAGKSTYFQGCPTSSTLEQRRNYLILPYAGAFIYVPISMGEVGTHLARFRVTLSGRTPPFEGMVFLDRKCYWVTWKDSRKGVIRMSREVNLLRKALTYKEFENGTILKPPADSSPAPLSSAQIDQLTAELGGLSEDEECAIADRISQDQIQTLLRTSD